MSQSTDAVMTTLLAGLADGEFHSGEELGLLLGVSRTAIWKQLQKLEGLGLVVASVKGRGYRLPRRLDLLVLSDIEHHMTAAARQQLTLNLALSTDSTNARAMAAAAGQAHGQVFLAEQQTAGRGRRGRTWASPFGANLYLSLVWGFFGGAASLSGLSLAVGVACTRVLRRAGLISVGLKWPNDLLVGEKKLGGILLEMAGDPAGECRVVIGIGINVDMPASAEATIDQAWTDLQREGCSVSRSQLTGLLLSELTVVLREFALAGFAGFKAEWTALDAFKDAPVTLSSVSHSVSGLARGVDATGALVLDVDGELQVFHGGEVSLRLRGPA